MAETIKDYLVSLGFKVEKGQEARFNETIGGIAKTAAVVAASLTAAAATIAASVIKIAAEFDSLYFAAQRSNTSVAQIKALTYALSQVGMEAGETRGAIDAMATALRTSPGPEGLLNKIGIVTRDNGKMRDTVAILLDLNKVLEGKSGKERYYISAQIASIFNIPESTFNVLNKNIPEIERRMTEYKKQAAELGVDPDKAAAGANKLMTSFREMSLTIGLVSDKIASELQPILSKYLKEFGDWVKGHSVEIRDTLFAILEAFRGLVIEAVALAKSLKPVVDAIIEIAKALTGDKDGLKAAFKVVLTYVALVWAVQMIAAIASVYASLSLLSKHPMIRLLATLMGTTNDIGPVTMMPGAGAAPPEADNWWTRTQNAVRRPLGMKPIGNDGKPKGTTEGLNKTFKERIDKMLAEAPENIRNAVAINSGYRSAEEQAQLYAAAVKKYGSEEEARKWVAPPGKSAHNTGEAVDFGFGSPEASQWVHENAAKYGLEFKLGNEPWHGTPVKDPDYLSRARQNQSFLFGGGNQTALMGSVSRSASIEQRTNIVINGSTDPAGTGTALERGQSRVNADLLANTRSAFA